MKISTPTEKEINDARLLKWDEENKDGKAWAEEQKKS